MSPIAAQGLATDGSQQKFVERRNTQMMRVAGACSLMCGGGSVLSLLGRTTVRETLNHLSADGLGCWLLGSKHPSGGAYRLLCEAWSYEGNSGLLEAHTKEYYPRLLLPVSLSSQ